MFDAVRRRARRQEWRRCTHECVLHEDGGTGLGAGRGGSAGVDMSVDAARTSACATKGKRRGREGWPCGGGREREF